ncbi:5-(carboxyamino)imidazole ribonucleotide synthase [Allofustis seminis]|uniref:5-(carboxyamino)imidazole ribonucleotide synthase n=1 Tax=Allofustis seminis TaxID=166939 RepID=UPI0003740499|nr:5-(carboxyamino)imidazole ribonucleotide synthase [Allofustis seminis]
MKKIKRGQTIGIIGAGQLGKMLALSAQAKGYRIAMYDPNPQACGFSVADTYQVGSFDDRTKLLQFIQQTDVVTYEFENIDGPLLEEIAEKSYLPQGATFLQTTQDRLMEKSWLASLDIPVVAHHAVRTLQDLQQAACALQYPFVLKTTRFGYDGKGQEVLKTPQDLDKPEVHAIVAQGAVAEAFCPFQYEASIIVARDLYGNIECFPAARNEHRSGILFASIVPLANEKVIQKMHAIAFKIAQKSELVGVCGVEFFVTEQGEIYVNELAPRPHNSGHYTIEACSVSQFDQHIDAICGQALAPIILHSDALMVNILGQHVIDIETVREHFKAAHVHFYRKGESRTGRKMGHWTCLAPNAAAITQMLATPFLSNWRDKF